MATPRVHLWSLDIATKAEKRLTSDAAYSVTRVTLSDDGKWIGFNATPDDRYQRNITEEGDNSDVYLLEVASGKIERLTNNVDVSESALSFSPDGQSIAFTAADDYKFMHLNKLYVRPVAGGQWRKLGKEWDGDVSIGWWSDDSKTIYFNAGWHATTQLFSIDVASGKVMPLTNLQAATNVSRDEATDRLMINYADPMTPPSAYTVASLAQVLSQVDVAPATIAPVPDADDYAVSDAQRRMWLLVEMGGRYAMPGALRCTKYVGSFICRRSAGMISRYAAAILGYTGGMSCLTSDTHLVQSSRSLPVPEACNDHPRGHQPIRSKQA